MEEKGRACKIYVDKFERKILLERRRSRWENAIKLDHKI
jgi:hypothetical protein